MLACGRCKKPTMKLSHSVWKNGKEIGITKLLVCKECYDRAKKLKA